jgi:hypothetical protein
MQESIPVLNLLDGRPNEDFNRDIDIFLKTDTSLLKQIFSDVDSNWKSNWDDEKKRLAKKFSVDEKDVLRILAIGIVIFSRLKDDKITQSALNEDLEKLGFDTTYSEKIKEIYEASGAEFIQKYYLRTAFLDNLYEGTNRWKRIVSKLNYRIITDKNKKIMDLVPVVEFNISVYYHESASESEKKETEVKFQATEEELNKMIEIFNNKKNELLIASEYLKGLKRE